MPSASRSRGTVADARRSARARRSPRSTSTSLRTTLVARRNRRPQPPCPTVATPRPGRRRSELEVRRSRAANRWRIAAELDRWNGTAWRRLHAVRRLVYGFAHRDGSHGDELPHRYLEQRRRRPRCRVTQPAVDSVTVVYACGTRRQDVGAGQDTATRTARRHGRPRNPNGWCNMLIRASTRRRVRRSELAAEPAAPLRHDASSKFFQYRLGVGPRWPWYFEPSPLEPYGWSVGSAIWTNESWPIFISG